MSGSRTVDQIENELDKEEKLMFVHKTNGNYAEAQASRLKIEQLLEDHQARSLYQMNLRHKQEYNALIDSNNHEFAAFNDYWNKREAEIKAQEDKMEAQMLARHKSEIIETTKELEVLYSPKLKQSSQLLNLRKMQEHMAKQKIFHEAQRVQKQIFLLQKTEKSAWLQKRDQKIQTALTTLRGKQSVELANLKKRYKTLLDQAITDRKIQDQRLLFKHNNLLKDQKSQHEKENLNLKGQFRSKGGKDSPMRTRSSFHA